MSKVRKVQSTNYTTTAIPKTGAEWVWRTRPIPRRVNFFTRTTPRLLRYTEDQNQYCWSEDHEQDTGFHFTPKTKNKCLGLKTKTKTKTDSVTSRPVPGPELCVSRPTQTPRLYWFLFWGTFKCRQNLFPCICITVPDCEEISLW